MERTPEKSLKTRLLNDSFRASFQGGQVVLTTGVNAIEPATLSTILNKVRTYADFNEDNDPWGEHDLGMFQFGSHFIMWKIDYYTPDMEHGSEDPSDPVQTVRVLTVMLADEY